MFSALRRAPSDPLLAVPVTGSKSSDRLRAASTPARAKAQKRHLEVDAGGSPTMSPARRSARPSR